MSRLRPYLRLYAAAWLVFQVTSFSTLVPRDCCAAHRPAQAERQPPCHEAAPVPQHGGHVTHHGAADVTDETGDTCRLRGACDGPMAGLLAQLAQQGVLSDPISIAPALVADALGLRAREHLIGRLVPPDSPPPRA